MKEVTFLKSTLSHLGGLEKYTLYLARAFRDRGDKVRIITTGATDQITDMQGIDIESFSFTHNVSALKVLQFDRFCEKALKTQPPQVIFSLDRNQKQTHLRAGNGVHRAYLERRKAVEGRLKGLSFELNPLHKILLYKERVAFEDKELKTLFTNSHMVKQEILNYFNIDAKKIAVVHNGVPWQQLQDPFEKSFTEKKSLSLRLGLDPISFHLLFLGHNFRRKGLGELLKALSLIQGVDFHLSVVGHDREISFFRQMAQQLHMEKRVTFFGKCSDVRGFYQIADCLVLPSHYDPFANVTLEALAMGVSIITTASNGASEIVQPFAGTIIGDPSFIEELRAALMKAFLDPKRKEKAQNIRNSVSHLTIESQTRKIYDITHGAID